jgi:hypothetical protein
MNIQVPQSMPMAAPTAVSTPAADILKVAEAPFDLETLVEVPVLEPVVLVVEVAGLLVEIVDEGYCEPCALISKGCEVARICYARRL